MESRSFQRISSSSSRSLEDVQLLEADLPLNDSHAPSNDGDLRQERLMADFELEELRPGPLRSVKIRLYLSHFLSTWNSRVFEFGAVLYLATIFPNTLLPMSIYAVARAASAIMFSPAVGRYIDTKDRLHVVRLSIVLQRVVVAISCLTFWFLESNNTLANYVQYLTLVLLSILACVEKLCSVMNLVAVERDWVIIVVGDDMDTLATLNAQMRRIDLLCKLVGPLLIAFFDGLSTRLAIQVNLGMNVISIPLEYFAIAVVYKQLPALQALKAPILSVDPSSPSSRQNCIRKSIESLTAWWRQLVAYFRNPASLPSFAISTLYFTVLGFAGQMVTYLISAGYSSMYVGIARTASVIFEMGATWIAPLVMSKIGPIRSGAWFSTWQTLCLAAGVAVFWQASSPLLSASALVVGTILSRVGLRGFELAIQIIVQEEVDSDQRGSFSAVEASWQNFFELCSFSSTIVFSKPSKFRWPVLMSLIATGSASIMYASFVRARRGHLLHLSDCVESKTRKVLAHREGFQAVQQT